MTGTPTVYTIGAETSFVDALASGIVAQVGDAPEALSAVTVLLPTRRACRALADAFLRLGEGRALLLPQMSALGDVDDDDEAFDDDHALDLPPAIPTLHSQLLLTRLILSRDDMAATPDQAARLATELARLLDQVQTERLSFDGLSSLVETVDLSDHWQKTVEFLKILTDHWPGILKAEGYIDPIERRNAGFEARTAAWTKLPPAGLVIAAGSTGSIPATADLLKCIALMPQGALVLPGLDRDATDAVWDELEASHPQYGMARLLGHVGIERGDVGDWQSDVIASAPSSRTALINAALVPASVTDTWQHRTEPDADALDGLSVIEAANEHDEAGSIAMLMREALTEPDKTAALVTPDRGLARRVASELKRWDIDVDDSAGRPLADSVPATFLRLAARAAAEGFAPISLLGLLKHPLAAGGQQASRFRAMVRRLEIAVLRGPRPSAGLDGLKTALAESRDKDDADLLALLDALQTSAAPFVEAFAREEIPLKPLLAGHIAFIEALATTPDTSGPERIWAGDDGEALSGFVADLLDSADSLGDIDAAAWPALLDALLAGRAVRPRYGLHPRLHIWGLMEARLQHADVTILGGLNEGSWPPQPDASPWMSRPMMDAFGLPQPERRLGLTAHDFTQAFAAPRVVLSRAGRSGGAPTVPSRWLLRLRTLLTGTALKDKLIPDRRWSEWLRTLNTPEEFIAPTEPKPMPPVALRPREMSVTRVEKWVRDPYALYAGEILKLRELDAIDADPGAADRGILVHEALDRFFKTHPDSLPDDAYDKLVDIGREVFGEHLSRPGVLAFWWPRFKRIARWFIDDERLRRDQGWLPLATETRGEMPLDGPAGDFMLTARADRIDRHEDGGLGIVDYKTGAPPTWKQVATGLAPQLSLEATMATGGHFNGVDEGEVRELLYLHLSGGRVPGKRHANAKDVEEMAGDAIDGLKKRIADFDDEATPYLSRTTPMFQNRGGDFDHLARVREWMTGDDGDGE
ncbi:MAG: double-strand break repair protein AddB [Rhodospirillaceae bacterium]|jgi:ATP-dependent helicase/nuclease subunit B|nr:double-strand break repair protein AddB [Rhodospirillaceae bacterium]MBT5308410.1 double-strand break repair protein AddB [Rhodospirillaceae bacterium]MBT7356800.1 double-strand break repair protein AddB [Rhodospirillaceae bacterium]